LPAQPVEQDTISPLELFFGLVLPTNRCSVSAIPRLLSSDTLRRLEGAAYQAELSSRQLVKPAHR
jgi:hypothetical protein